MVNKAETRLVGTTRQNCMLAAFAFMRVMKNALLQVSYCMYDYLYMYQYEVTQTKPLLY